VGQLLDQISILQIKQARFTDANKRANVAVELELLLDLVRAHELDLMSPEYFALKQVNEQLWDVENSLRDQEQQKRFDDRFTALARSVYQLNDRRADIKRQINLACGSELMEEKQYVH
jgi:hypothetical protein